MMMATTISIMMMMMLIIITVLVIMDGIEYGIGKQYMTMIMGMREPI